ncbi:MAG: argininosuccinate synthase [Eudoraea sp.]|nr:argininosuccinate synthase [Eudoraea sp.]
MKKIVLAYSGGLDTSYCLTYLSHELGYTIHAVTVNTGGFTEEDIAEMKTRAGEMGSESFTAIDAIETYYQNAIKYLIYGNVLRNNTYPLSVSAERIVQAMEIVNYAKEIGADGIAHGSTGAGNDQVRFDTIFQTIAPEMEIITPIRDSGLSRQQEIDYLNSKGFDFSWNKAKYSINQGLWGTSVGGAETLTSRQPLPGKAYPSQPTKTDPVSLKLSFEKGEFVALNDKKDTPVVNIQKLQEIAAEYAIGRDIHVGDTIIGIKGRVGFEAAAAILIIKAHHLLEKHTLSKWQLFQKDQLASFYGMLLHEGQYLDAVMRDIEAYLDHSQGYVTGHVFLTLHPHRYELEGIESEYDLMTSAAGTYGEENKGWSADDAKGFIKISANAGKIARQIQS